MFIRQMIGGCKSAVAIGFHQVTSFAYSSVCAMVLCLSVCLSQVSAFYRNDCTDVMQRTVKYRVLWQMTKQAIRPEFLTKFLGKVTLF